MLENQLSRYGSISRNIPFGKIGPCGKVFFAVHPYAQHLSSSDDGTLAPWVATVRHEFPVDKDGVVRMHSTIQAAVDATTDGRGDVILVGPGKWKEEVYIVDHNNLHIIGSGTEAPAGTDQCRMRPGDASTHYAFTTKIGTAEQGAAFHVLSKGVEITGFYLDGGGNYGGIYLGGGLNGGITGYDSENASGAWIHHNFFRGGNEGAVGLYMNGPRFGVRIENNYFERWTAGAIQIDAGNANCENAVIANNTFAASNGGYGIDIYGEANVKTTCIGPNNVFCDGVSAAFAAGVYCRSGATGVTSVVGSFFPCATPLNLLATDYHSGCYKGTANATEVYVELE